VEINGAYKIILVGKWIIAKMELIKKEINDPEEKTSADVFKYM
jgi:hypothetical protein